MRWKSLIDFYDNNTDYICPIAHTYITPHIGILLGKNGEFLCSEDVSNLHDLVAVPCTIESEARTNNIAPHLLSDNLSYVCQYLDNGSKHRAYMTQLQAYINDNDDMYVNAIYQYVSNATLLYDVRDLLKKKWKIPEHKINIVFAVYGLPNSGDDDKWTDYYLKLLPKTGIYNITGQAEKGALHERNDSKRNFELDRLVEIAGI